MTMTMDLIRHIAGLYSGKAIKGDFTQVYITGNEIWMAQQILASQHTEQAEGAQGEQEAFEAWCRTNEYETLQRLDGSGYNNPATARAWSAWQARAALAQLSPAPELERPEVMAVLVLGGVFDGRELGDNDIVTVNPAIERLQAALVTDGEVLVELMTVPQHDRIVAARLDNARYNALAQDKVILQLKQERDAAQARVAELEQSQGAEVFLTLTSEITQLKAKLAELEKQKEFGHVFVSIKEGYKCFEFDEYSHAYSFPVGEHQLYAAPVAQAGQVPEKPTEAMLQAGMNAMAEAQRNGSQSLYAYAGVCWDAMLAAAPQPVRGDGSHE